jgi:hypothetical protein
VKHITALMNTKSYGHLWALHYSVADIHEASENLDVHRMALERAKIFISSYNMVRVCGGAHGNICRSMDA